MIIFIILEIIATAAECIQNQVRATNVALVKAKLDSVPFCTGVLIAPKFVVTVAACVEYESAPKWVSITATTRDDGQAFATEDLEVARAIVEPTYESHKVNHGVAIFELKTASKRTPAKIWTDSSLPKDSQLTAKGYSVATRSTIESTSQLLTSMDCVNHINNLRQQDHGILSRDVSCTYDDPATAILGNMLVVSSPEAAGDAILGLKLWPDKVSPNEIAAPSIYYNLFRSRFFTWNVIHNQPVAYKVEPSTTIPTVRIQNNDRGFKIISSQDPTAPKCAALNATSKYGKDPRAWDNPCMKACNGGNKTICNAQCIVDNATQFPGYLCHHVCLKVDPGEICQEGITKPACRGLTITCERITPPPPPTATRIPSKTHHQ
ncbi:hypothetical protein AC1031_004431 [Aphanomyces cochlioides]|nr:hypothetical protein AC1031_004431 [Aphanomyces cochlioides]